jgi:Lipocalin-like domain
MKRQSILSIAAAAVFALALLPGSAVSQQKTLKEQLVGTWTLVSVDVVLPDGTKRQLFGPNPKGIAIYTNDGYFSLIQMHTDLPKLASSNHATATPEEAKAVVAGSIAYFGRYSVDEASKIVTVDLQGSTFANQVGSATDNKRVITSLTASELKFTNPASASGATIDVVLRRAD